MSTTATGGARTRTQAVVRIRVAWVLVPALNLVFAVLVPAALAIAAFTIAAFTVLPTSGWMRATGTTGTVSWIAEATLGAGLLAPTLARRTSSTR